jgi:hypothetical protein
MDTSERILRMQIWSPVISLRHINLKKKKKKKGDSPVKFHVSKCNLIECLFLFLIFFFVARTRLPIVIKNFL